MLTGMSTRPIYCIFVAGGSGSRMAEALRQDKGILQAPDVPKQFLEMDGKPILQRTIERLTEALPEAKVITVLPAAHIGTWKEMCVQNEFNRSQILVAGGMTRFHSVQNALAKVPDGAVVAIHDGVRPLVSVSLIRRMAQQMEHCHALIPVTKVIDTLRWADPAAAMDSPAPDRSRMVAVQTPQMFWSEEIKAAYETAFDTRFTDDASVAERAGIRVDTLQGEYTNIKITTPEDLVLAKAILTCKD